MNITGITPVTLGIAMILFALGKVSFGMKKENHEKTLESKKNMYLFVGVGLVVVGLFKMFHGVLF